ncbi:hypothetical protein ACFL0V_01080 [Nanoarchaeota archaeon]
MARSNEELQTVAVSTVGRLMGKRQTPDSEPLPLTYGRPNSYLFLYVGATCTGKSVSLNGLPGVVQNLEIIKTDTDRPERHKDDLDLSHNILDPDDYQALHDAGRFVMQWDTSDFTPLGQPVFHYGTRGRHVYDVLKTKDGIIAMGFPHSVHEFMAVKDQFTCRVVPVLLRTETTEELLDRFDNRIHGGDERQGRRGVVAEHRQELTNLLPYATILDNSSPEGLVGQAHVDHELANQMMRKVDRTSTKLARFIGFLQEKRSNGVMSPNEMHGSYVNYVFEEVFASSYSDLPRSLEAADQAGERVGFNNHHGLVARIKQATSSPAQVDDIYENVAVMGVEQDYGVVTVTLKDKAFARHREIFKDVLEAFIPGHVEKIDCREYMYSLSDERPMGVDVYAVRIKIE